MTVTLAHLLTDLQNNENVFHHLLLSSVRHLSDFVLNDRLCCRLYSVTYCLYTSHVQCFLFFLLNMKLLKVLIVTFIIEQNVLYSLPIAQTNKNKRRYM